MPRNPKQKVINQKHYATTSGSSRAADAMSDGQEAAKLFGATAFTYGGTNNITNIIAAIDEENFDTFLKECKNAGIANDDLIERLWDATFGSLKAQSVKPCW